MATKKEEKEEVEVVEQRTLVPLEKYLEAGVHIGSKFKSGDMRRFVYKTRGDGLCVLDVNTLNDRIATAAKFIASFEPEKILVVAGRTYAQKPAKVFAETIGAKYIIGRFIPGTLTNPSNENFVEPELIVTADPPVDRQAIKEAKKAKIPVVSLCDTSNMTRNIDMIIPVNNKGKKALALIYWLLGREVLLNKKIITSEKEYEKVVADFETKIILERRDRKESFGRGRGRGAPRGRGRGRR